MLRKAIRSYRNHFWETFPTTFFTVMLWMASQKIVDALVSRWMPDMQGFPLGVAELLIATFGLWIVVVLNNDRKKQAAR